MPSLKTLEAAFLTRRVEKGNAVYHTRVVPLSEADGVMFLCPKCFKTNKGKIGTHMVICWFVGKVPADAMPGPGRWNPSGTGIDDLTFVGPGATSVKLDSGCAWHGHVEQGNAE